MKRILFFMHTSSRIGGVETWLDRMHAHLQASGFDPIVGLVRGQTCNDPTRYKGYHPDLKTVEVDGRGLNREGRVRALVRCIREVKPQIIVPLGIVDANEAAIRCKLAGLPVRLVTHAQGNLAPMLADLACYRDWIDLAICPGRLTSKVLVEFLGFDAARVLTIPNGADSAIKPQVARPRQTPLRVGYVGRLSRGDKRALDLVGLQRELDRLQVDYRLEIVGDGACHAELTAAFADSEDRVRMHGAVPHDQLYSRIFPNLDVLVMTSASEAFGIVLVEAMMHGVVPVTSRYVGFHAEGLVVDDDNGLSFAVGDMQAAASAVSRLAQDSALLERLAESARARAGNYSWSSSLLGWESALARILNATPVQDSQRPVVPLRAENSLLDRCGMPAAASDLLRRVRRAMVGVAVAPGGEEWPLFNRHHPQATLDSIAEALRQHDAG